MTPEVIARDSKSNYDPYGTVKLERYWDFEGAHLLGKLKNANRVDYTPGFHRANNEDRFLVSAPDNDHALLAIADGMGGHAAGEVAAQIAVESFGGFSPGDSDIIAEILNQIEQAQRSILERSRLDPSLRGMGTTLTALFLDGRSALWAHVGDTRIYHLHEGSLTRITEDHTFPGMLLKKGEITREQARLHPYGNVLTRCVGCEQA